MNQTSKSNRPNWITKIARLFGKSKKPLAEYMRSASPSDVARTAQYFDKNGRRGFRPGVYLD